MSPRKPPVVTFALLGAIGAAYVLALALPASAPPSFATPPGETLVALGGASRRLLFVEREWWRLLAAPLLHGDPLQLLVNAIALWLGGALLEPMVGRARLL